MERSRLLIFAELFEEAALVGQVGKYQIITVAGAGEYPEVKGLNYWMNNNGDYHEGLYRLYNSDTDEDYGISLVDWRYNQDYYVVVMDNHKSSGAEVELKDEAGEELCWLYRPSKRDGRNLERKEAFKKIYGDLRVYFKVPQTIEELSVFIEELLLLAANRKKADNLGGVEK